MKAEFPGCLVGQRVEIEWRDEDCDWRTYRVLAASNGWLLLEKQQDQNDTTFWAPLVDMATIHAKGER